MSKGKKFVAMLLAGGQGSRLGHLTRFIAKPAVSFGGKYRIIDFSLSNCAHSSVDAVGVLTQYKPLALNAYIGTGEAWNLGSIPGGVRILPPYVGDVGGAWYKGTADAIYQNMDFLEFQSPDYVIILSGDHIYQMDYDQMLRFHREKQADVTISVMRVTLEEASRFGIMTTDGEGRITEFAEKPANPTSTLASMGVYIFSWPVLRDALLQDQADEQSEKDFGKNVIPALLGQQMRLFAYEFQGYWKDVGTIDGYYGANMDLLSPEPPFDIFNLPKHIYSNEEVYPPHYIDQDARVRNAIISNGCVVRGEVDTSILAPGVLVGRGARVVGSILLPGAKVGDGCHLERVIVGEQGVIERGTRLGRPEGSITVIPGGRMVGALPQML